jgi:hypothetical protein
LAEVALVQDQKGRFNVQDVEKRSRQASSGKPSSSDNLQFTGIDTLNLTLGKFHLSNLASRREEEIEFGIKNQISHNVKSEADLQGLSLFLAARAAMAGPSTNTPLDLTALLKSLTAH